MKHLFIINPVAGKGRPLGLIPEIRKHCDSRGYEYEIITTKYPGHATEIAKAHSAAQILRIYSVGGDGTLNVYSTEWQAAEAVWRPSRAVPVMILSGA
jgi:diacylglycerol kinase family enzyme